MNLKFWQRQRQGPAEGLPRGPAAFLGRLIRTLEIPAPDAAKQFRRIRILEREILLPVKVAGIGMVLYSFYISAAPWIGMELGEVEIAVQTTRYLVAIYLLINIVGAGLLFAMERLPLAIIRWTVFAMGIADGSFLSALSLVAGGHDSVLYWLFLGLIVRSAISMPEAVWQLTLNCCLIACYVLVGVRALSLAEGLDETTRGLLEYPDHPGELLALRSVLLALMTICCYGVQILIERQQQALEQARELGVREGQLRSAGRLAAEFAHQIKNPLAIINNASFLLERALRDGKGDKTEQIRIIKEEVERSDRIITQIMGYAQLSEGHVEKLNVIEELEEAIRRVFPPGAGFAAEVHRDYGPSFPPLLMQRRHLSDTLQNVLQNARDALDGKPGHVWVRARCLPDYTVEVAIRDDGPGIAPARLGQVFEAYFTTKEKGTGLGLATVKHNVELYGGSVRIESELGKGAAFVLRFPAKVLMRLAKAD